MSIDNTEDEIFLFNFVNQCHPNKFNKKERIK